ncbi:S8 family serine peptidase [Catellatospora citrea]|uniref:Type VII secretion-associated serine protease n=1 Tax=Catellatospora citrea TaxID=53366 RepID=A0A8J3K8H7_9ACTN|nr:S8 family serine peptidase [Catellatospora citrea]RKE08051.1 type VII secretion-associated serine protease mycosin [Catellatospora citrea]GIF98432.1 type VII secretion-associated serine protease [Catellatospora citrea]
MIRTTAFLGLVVSLLSSTAPAHAADEISDGQWFHSFLRTEEAHRITEGAGVTVAVIDTGIDGTHPDLRGSILPGMDLSEEGPGDGRTDKEGHGTAMAGLIAAHGKVKGIAPAAKVLPVRESVWGAGNTTDIVEAIRWATTQRVDVISVSLAEDLDDPDMRAAVADALKADIVIVAGAGNTPDSTVGFPAAIPGVIAVAGVGRDGEHAKISVTGASIVISAPSDDISSTGVSHLWRKGTGTSDATAIVAGAVALVRAKYPDLSGPEVVHRLTSTAIDKGPAGRDAQYGYGVLNVVGALTADLPPHGSPTPSPSDHNDPASNGRSPWLWAIGAIAVVGLLVLFFRSRRRG